jgi:hypothetical protein
MRRLHPRLDRRFSRRGALLFLAAAGALAACASVQPPAGRATLVVTSEVPEASVWIDDHYAGLVGAWRGGQPIPSGFRRVEVRHPSHFSFFAELNPRAGETVRVTAVLRPIPD